ncbi:MAG: hypothetical protein B7Y99_04470 [Caulobacterales bacterium 32-69-10]|nr:MAG: hypothetical protein B7Y99_04470 [Caulobacterales bacterium 32-69-10]
MKKRAATHAALAHRSAATAIKAGKAMSAAAEVIAARANLCASPTGVSGVEMNLMVSEKVAAFSEAGAALSRGASDMAGHGASYVQAEAAAAQRGAAQLAACRTPMELFALQSRLFTDFVARGMAYGLDLNTAATKTGEDALHPIHKVVAANAKRLKK